MAGISLGTKLSLGQGLLMTPQLQQAIKLLQLSRLELEQFVETQLSENPVLEETSSDIGDDVVSNEREATESQAVLGRLDAASSIVDQVSKDDKPDIDWDSLARYEESRHQASAGGQKGLGDDEDGSSNYENIAAKTRTIHEHLQQQVSECDFSEEERMMATVIVGNLDDKGYLTISLEEICAQEKFDPDLAEGVLDTIQRFDPAGVGARTLQECLLNQLKLAHIKNPIVEAIISNHLMELENRNYSAIAKLMKIPLEKIFENVAVIAGLEPNPGRPFSPEATQYIIPDVFVFKLGTEWVVSMNEDGLPRLKISPFYKKMLKDTKALEDKESGKEKDYLKEKIKTADWLIKSLHQRQSTIFRVTEKIVERQREFFDYGVQYLKPMILRDIADSLELHESTISRVTTHKYVHTPRGVFELKYFFNGGVSTGDGVDVANEAVRNKISELVKSEDVKKPYSDQQIVEMLERDNINLARRTVAKYREQMNILPSSKRRKPF